MSARPSGTTASSTHGRGFTSTSSATVASRRCASSSRRRGSSLRVRRGAHAGDQQPACGRRTAPAEPLRRSGSATARPRYRRHPRMLLRPDSCTTIGDGSAATRSTIAPDSGRHSSEYSSSTAGSKNARWQCAASAQPRLEPLVERLRKRDDLSARKRSRRRRADHLRGPLRRGRLRRRLPRTRPTLLRRRRRGIRRGGRHGDRLRHRPSTRATSNGHSASSVPQTSASRTGRAQSSAIAPPPSFAPASKNSTRWSPLRGPWTRPCAGCRRPLSSAASSARPSDGTASDTRGRFIVVSEVHDGRCRNGASVRRSTTRRRRSPTPRSGPGLRQAAWR